MRASKREIVLSLIGLLLFSEALFLFKLDAVKTWIYDESYYVPAAIELWKDHRDTNVPHPPLGKTIIGASMAAFGNRPFGWRFSSTLFGALTVLGMYVWALVIFKDQWTAVWVALLSLFDNMLFVQARIATLDIFLAAFTVWGMAAFWAAMDFASAKSAKANRRFFYALCASGLALGLAGACKWIAFFALLMEIAIFVDFKLRHGREWASWKALGISLILIPILAYISSYVLIRPSPAEWLQMQIAGLHFHQNVLPHPYMSAWYTWPLMIRPMGYAFNREGLNGEFVREVFMVGNPIIIWFGLLAMIACGWEWLRRRGRETFIIVASYVCLFFCWVDTPRSTGFFYYYFPAALTLGFALAHVFRRFPRARWIFLLACLAMFVYFYPVLAGLKISTPDFARWAWFKSWI